MVAPQVSLREVVRSWSSRSPRGAVFDFNGTLSDDEEILLDVFTGLFARHLHWEMAPSEYYSRLAGRSDREIIQTVIAEHAPSETALLDELLRERREAYEREVTARPPIRPGTEALVARLALQGVPVAVVTGAQRADVLRVLRGSPVGAQVQVLVTEEDVTAGKPDPEGYLTAADRLGLEPSRILVFEDSIPGARAALAAGMYCIGVAGTHPPGQLEEVTGVVVPSLEESIVDPDGAG